MKWDEEIVADDTPWWQRPFKNFQYEYPHVWPHRKLTKATLDAFYGPKPRLQKMRAEATINYAYNPNDWLTCSWFRGIANSPDQFNIFTVPETATCYFNAVSSASVQNHNQWLQMDFTPICPPGTKVVVLAGILIITHGYTAETADLEVYFRRDSSVSVGVNYNLQCIEPFVGGGQRCCASIVIPLDNNMQCQWRWMAAGYPNGTTPVFSYPTYSAYGINLRAVACAG